MTPDEEAAAPDENAQSAETADISGTDDQEGTAGEGEIAETETAEETVPEGPSLLTFSEADYATMVSFYTMIAKMFLTVVLVPRGAYYIEAILLSAYLAVSVLIMTFRGLYDLKKAEKQDAPEPVKKRKAA